jgi:hypothetical protein
VVDIRPEQVAVDFQAMVEKTSLDAEFDVVGDLRLGRSGDGGALEPLPVQEHTGDEIDAAMNRRGDANLLGQLPIPDVVAAGALDIER